MQLKLNLEIPRGVERRNGIQHLLRPLSAAHTASVYLFLRLSFHLYMTRKNVARSPTLRIVRNLRASKKHIRSAHTSALVILLWRIDYLFICTRGTRRRFSRDSACSRNRPLEMYKTILEFSTHHEAYVTDIKSFAALRRRGCL